MSAREEARRAMSKANPRRPWEEPVEKKRKPIAYRSKKQAARKRGAAREAANGEGLSPPQTSCQHPDCETPDEPLVAHHVVYQQHLRRFGGDAGDAANTISLCVPCHMGKQHSQASPLPLSSLAPENIGFIYGLMGPGRAEVYLTRYYQPEVDGD